MRLRVNCDQPDCDVWGDLPVETGEFESYGARFDLDPDDITPAFIAADRSWELPDGWDCDAKARKVYCPEHKP
jgi:hypothetical protein